METLATLSPSDSAEEEHESGRMDKRRKLLGSIDALLPHDLIMYGIVARLPATTAARLCLVSKAWKATIRTRGFSELQSSLARLPDAVVLICLVYPDYRLYLIDLAAASASFEPPREVKLGCCRSGMAGYILVGACHGLVCFFRDHRLLVINPVTGETLRLNSSAAAAALTSNYYSDYFRCGFGFGFDPDRKEYKIVRIMFDETARKAVDAEVCAFNLDELQVQYDDSDSDSNNDGECRWRRRIPLPAEINNYPSRRAWVNGNFHWLIRNDYAPRQILAFDVRDERFRTLPVPPEARPDWQLAELGGRLAYVDSLGWQRGLLGVWIMDEYGRGDSWRHAFDLEVGLGPGRDEWLPLVLGYWKGDTGKLLMKAGERLCLYDLRTGRKDFTLLRLPASSSQPDDVYDISFVTGRLY